MLSVGKQIQRLREIADVSVEEGTSSPLYDGGIVLRNLVRNYTTYAYQIVYAVETHVYWEMEDFISSKTKLP